MVEARIEITWPANTIVSPTIPVGRFDGALLVFIFALIFR